MFSARSAENLPACAGNWSERLLKSLYYVTWQHGDQLLQETEALWQTVARNRRNVIPVLDFVLSCGLQEGASQTTAQVCIWDIKEA